MKKHVRLTKEEEDATFLLYKEGNDKERLEAGRLLHDSVFNWAYLCVQRRSNGYLDRRETKSLAGFIIAKALLVHDPSRGKLTNIVKWVARTEVNRHLAKMLGPVYVPMAAHEAVHEDIREAAARGSKVAKPIQYVSNHCAPSEVTKEDLEQQSSERAKWEYLYQEALASLKKERWRDILHRRHQGETLETLAEEYNVTWQRIQQITYAAAIHFSLALAKYHTEDWQPMSPLANRELILDCIRNDRKPNQSELKRNKIVIPSSCMSCSKRAVCHS